MNDAYVLDEGVFRLPDGDAHREAEYDSSGVDNLRQMQERHFWYRGRHRFLSHAFRRILKRQGLKPDGLRVIDLGGGCGGWVKYMANHGLNAAEVAVGDSSLLALKYAGDVVPETAGRYQIDILRLDWRERWDVAFLLDVLEHIPDERAALQEIWKALAPGGLLFVTTPALRFFWSWNDDAVHHQRRYSKADFRRLAQECGYELISVRYFMFFLSPLLLLSRWLNRPDLASMSAEEVQQLLERTHRVPHWLPNAALTAMFVCETPLGHLVPFPWGTSILAVLRRRQSF